jgi:hypothetical protein
MLPYCPDSALLPIRPEPDPLGEEPKLDVSDIEGFHKLVASGRLAEILIRIAGQPNAILAPFHVAVVKAEQTPPMLRTDLEYKDAQRRDAPLLGRIGRSFRVAAARSAANLRVRGRDRS